jgi:hypothetical protein
VHLKRDIYFAADHESTFDHELLDRFQNSFVISNPASSTIANFNTANNADENNSPPPSPNQETFQSSTLNTYSNVFSFSNSGNNKQQQVKIPSTIYKINLDFLIQSGSNEKFNQLCENSARTIKREMSNFSSQFIFSDQDDLTNSKHSIYHQIISSNVGFLF